MKRCERCGREGERMKPIHNRWVKRIDGWECWNLSACISRMKTLGQWVGTRVQHRRDLDGTQWTIRRAPRPGMTSSGPWYVLTCQYLQHRTTSWHSTPDAAKAHRDDVTASWEARSLREYAAGPTTEANFHGPNLLGPAGIPQGFA